MNASTVHPVDEKLPAGRLTVLGLQHVLVMYAGAIAVPLIVGRALKLTPEQVALLISADLFACGIVSLIQSFGVTKYFGIKLPVMMGVTFAAVAIAAWLWPEYVQAEQINGLGYGGAVLVVLGSALVALGPSLMAGLRARRVRMAAS